MRLSCTPLSLAAWFALGATAAVAAPSPVPSGGGPKPQAKCPAPTAAKCLEKDYLDSKCGQKYRAVCNPFVKEAMEYHEETKVAPKLKMLRPKLSEMPKDVVQGKYFAYKKDPGITLAETSYRKAGDVLAGIAGMDMSTQPPVDRVTKVDPNEAAKFFRKPAWKDNGYAIHSCKEYAYARSYNGTRFIDAASACRGDRECVFSVAYMNGPTGIAKPKLYDEAGELMTRQLLLPKGKFPKNDMFVAGLDEFIEVPSLTMPNGLVAQNAEVAALKSTLRAGKDFYEIGLCTGGSCNGKTRFADVWGWHKHLHDETVTLSQNEAEEYERRRAKFRALLEQWSAAVAWEKSVGKGIVLEQPIVLPFDMHAYDPFERYKFEREYIERGRETRQMLKQRYGVEILSQPRSVAIPQMQHKQGMQGSMQRSGAAMAAGLFAAPTPVPAKPKPKQAYEPTGPGSMSAVEHTQAYLSDAPQLSKCVTLQGWGFEALYKGPISCRIQEFLLGEWRRKAAGQKSCLDLGNPDCDWTPQMFEAGVLDQVQGLDVQVADEAFCTAYVEGGTFTDANNPGGKSTVTDLTKILGATRTRIEKELKGVSEYRRTRTPKGQPLGKDWEGGGFEGDKDWFAAGYDYGVGWEVAPATKQGSAVCEIEGSIHGDVSFDAWIVGGKIPVVEGAVRVEARPISGGRYNAELSMMGMEVFNSGGWAAAQPYHPDDDSGLGVQVPGGVKPRFDIYVGVPISGQMWGELIFGSALQMRATASAACGTEINNPKFAISARYMPFFAAFGIGKVGVGLAGVASAGVIASLNLVMVGLPLDVGITASMKDSKPTISFVSELSLMLATLSGRVSLYVEVLMFEEEFELFRWKGFSTRMPLLPKLTADVSFTGLR